MYRDIQPWKCSGAPPHSPDVSLRGPEGAVAISGRHLQFARATEKTHKPIASVAALSERHWQLQILKQFRRPCRFPDLSLRGAKRRGNLGKAAAISPKASPRCGRVLRDCHVASLLAMTRQGSARCTSALLPLNIPYKAVTDRRYTPYFGVCRFHGRLYGSGVRSREGHAAPLQCTAGGLCIFHSSFFSLQDSFPCAPPLQCTAESLVQLPTFHSRLSTSIPLCRYT